ncbi:uncharacterized protein LOC129590889 isoform X2 [Paramacrobiotus metropolitanus]|nr:uncharacterized protein LOC129590889 isoform X2 [Paramacrobiotus metropolitanus]
MLDILDSFPMATPAPPSSSSPGADDSPVAAEEPYPDSQSTSTLSSDSGLQLQRNSAWRNSSSSSSSNQSSLSLVSDRDLDHLEGSTGNRLSTHSTGSKTHYIMEEIIQTEKNYVSDLQQICQGYLQPMNESSLFSSIDVVTVFGNLEEIWEFHQHFLERLIPPDMYGPAYIASAFSWAGEQFPIYTTYCSNYPSSVTHLAGLMQQQPAWFKQQQAAAHHALPLGPYLLKPIQRVLKYHLLLDKLLDSCDADYDGYATVERALETMKRLAEDINEVQRQKERRVRLQELQVLLVELPAELSTQQFGELLMEDMFPVSIGKRAKSDRNVFLFENGLLIVKQREDSTFHFKFYIAHSNLMLSEVIPESPLLFSVIPFDNPTNSQLITLEAKNLEHKRAWTSRLKELLLKHFGANIPEHVRQLVMELGAVNQPANDTDSATRRFRNFFTTANAAPDYLAKRRTKSPAREYVIKTDTRNVRDMRRKTAPVLDFDATLEPKLVKPVGKPPKKEKERKATSVFHVSVTDAYAPRMKEDEFLYEETHVMDLSRSDGDRRRSSVSLQESETVVSTPRRQLSRKPSIDEPETPEAGDTSTLRFKGLRSAFGKAYKQTKDVLIKPIIKSFNSEDNKPVSSYFGSGVGAEILDADCMDSGMSGTLSPADGEQPGETTCRSSETNESDGFYERDLELLETLAGDNLSCGDGDSAVYSDKEQEDERIGRSKPSMLENLTHPKLRRIYGSTDSSLDKPTKTSIRRKAAIKRRPSAPKVKSAPSTPRIADRTAMLCPRASPSELIQEKIKSLEEKAHWKSSAPPDPELRQIEEIAKATRKTSGHHQPRGGYSQLEPQLHPPTDSEISLRPSWVNMMVKKIESGSGKI